MCGIAGYQGRFDDFSSGRVEQSLIARMIARIDHRGPDDRGVWSDADHGLALGQTRLSIIDLSPAGHQPMHSADGHCTIVFNGEIYNFRELREELIADDFEFRGGSDTEVLLALYQRDGEALLERLDGMFAFALWDARRRALLIARDGYGVKPLYFASLGEGLIFASEIKALIECPQLPRELDPTALHRYLTYLWSPGTDTPFRAVGKLEPGEAMWVRDGAISRRWHFYDLPYQAAADKAGWSVDDACDALRDHLNTAVERQMVADVPVGAFLSGGLDSSAVVALARAQRDERIPCFTIESDDAGQRREGFADDLPYARRVAKQLDVDLHVVKVGPEMVEALPFMLYHLDEPQADLAPLNVFHISRLAHQHGVKVLLSGAGGDDILSGYPRHRAVAGEGLWNWAPRPLRRLLRTSSQTLPRGNPLGRRLARLFEYADLDDDERLASYFYRGNPGRLAKVFHPDLRARLNPDSVAAPLRDALARLPDGTDMMDRCLYLDGKFFLPDHNFNYTDKMSMATGLEVRVPFLDRDLVRFATGLPSDLKQHGPHGKWIFKKAMQGSLDHDVIWRPKTGFGVPLRSWLHTGLAPMLEHWLSDESLNARGLFDPAAVRRLVADDRVGRIDAAYSILSLIAIEGWCRLFIDGDAVPAPPPGMELPHVRA